MDGNLNNGPPKITEKRKQREKAERELGNVKLIIITNNESFTTKTLSVFVIALPVTSSVRLTISEVSESD